LSYGTHLDLPALEGLGDTYSARADAIGCLALRLNRVDDPAAAAIVVETMNRIMLTIPLPKAEAELVSFDTFRKRQAERG
jgi:hypothetical protein